MTNYQGWCPRAIITAILKEMIMLTLDKYGKEEVDRK
jgi:hypothetical protein